MPGLDEPLRLKIKTPRGINIRNVSLIQLGADIINASQYLMPSKKAEDDIEVIAEKEKFNVGTRYAVAFKHGRSFWGVLLHLSENHPLNFGC